MADFDLHGCQDCGPETKHPERTKPLITVSLWCINPAVVRWRCQCGETQTCTPVLRPINEKGTFHTKRTALQDAELTAIRHLEEKHPLSQLQWKTLSEDTTP